MIFILSFFSFIILFFKIVKVYNSDFYFSCFFSNTLMGDNCWLVTFELYIIKEKILQKISLKYNPKNRKRQSNQLLFQWPQITNASMWVFSIVCSVLCIRNCMRRLKSSSCPWPPKVLQNLYSKTMGVKKLSWFKYKTAYQWENTFPKNWSLLGQVFWNHCGF